jgi:hypothetical protein
MKVCEEKFLIIHLIYHHPSCATTNCSQQTGVVSGFDSVYIQYSLKINFFWNVRPCSLVEINQDFVGI